MAPAITLWPSWNPWTAEPRRSMTPTGSWPIVSPLATGYSPFRMWTSVPQIVVVVIRMRASSGPTSGIGFSPSTMRPGSAKIAAFIVAISVASLLRLSTRGRAPALELAQPRRLLVLVVVHPLEQRLQLVDRFQQIGSLVQHHTLGAGGHGRVGHLAARRDALGDKMFEHLRGPNHRRVAGFAEPEDLFLHLRRPGEADLDRQVAARDHDGGRLPSRGLNDHLGQVGHRARRLDLQDQRDGPPVVDRKSVV